MVTGRHVEALAPTDSKSVAMRACEGVTAGGALTPMRDPKMPPKTWAIMYSPPLFQEVCPVRQVAKVTAGFRCPPDTFAVMYTAVTQ